MKWQCFFIFFLIGMIFTTGMTGQFYTTGEPPASIRWFRITTPHFNIVYPAGLTVDANKFANRLEYYLPLSMGDLEHRMNKKFSVLLNSASVISNGYVTLAPARMEIVTTPPQDSYAQDWITQLALHEYRHVVQLNKLNQGFTKALGWFTGEIAEGIVSSQIPSWFYEGDAVSNETRLSESGRGRVPGFEMPLRTLILDRSKGFSYDKAVFGSYRDFVPDQYCYGYQMVSYARSKFGNKVWSQALDYTSRHPFFIWPLAFYMKENLGVYKTGLYKQTMDSIKEQYIKQKDIVTSTEYSTLNKRNNKIFTSYILPKDIGNGKTLAIQTGLGDPDAFVSIDSTGNICKVFITGRFMKLKCDLFGNHLIWDEVVSDPRWEKRDYSEIRMADLRTGRRISLTKRTRYFSPDFSPDGKEIAVVETDEQNRHYVTILDASSGNFLRRIPATENQAIQYPEWINHNEILMVTVSEKGKQLEVLNLENENWNVLLPYTRFDITEPLNYKNYILFRSSFKGIENIYAVSKLNSAIIYQVTFSIYGAYHPSLSVDSVNLLFSDYGPHGFNVASIPMDSSSWTPIMLPAMPPARWTSPNEAMKTISYDSVSTVSYKATPYKKSIHLFNFHSWLPFYTDFKSLADNPDQIPIYPGIMLFSQNLLSTVTTSIGYSYDKGYHKFFPSIRWSGWYPVIELSGQLGGPLRTLPLPDGIKIPDNASPYYEISLKTYIPLVYNRGNHITLVQPTLEYQQSDTWYYSGSKLLKGIDYLHLRMSINHYKRFSQRDFYPRWGQFLSATYTETPVENKQFGNLFSMQAAAFFPGLTSQHHLYIRGGIQVQHPQKYFIPINRIDFPRGYRTAVSRKFTSVMINYSFPAGYPDLSIGPLLYLKRLRVNFFHDWSYGAEIFEYNASGVVRYTGAYRSYGTEILGDIHIFRFLFPVTAGIRMGYIPGKQKFFSELIMNVETSIF
jgi:hypothetical protein